MAVRHVISGGTKVSGNSTADDWTLANCYPTVATAIAAAGIAAGDELILEHMQTHEVAAMISKSLGIVGAYTIRGRFARVNNLVEPESVISGSSESGSLFLFNDTVNRADIEFRDLKFTKSVAHTDATRPYVLHASQKTGDITLTRCWIKGVSVSIAGATAYELGAISYAATPTAPATISYNYLTFEDITGTFGTGGACLLSNNGYAAGTYKYTGLVMHRLSVTSGGSHYYFRVDSTGNCTVDGFDAEDVVGVSTNTLGFGSFFTRSGTGFFRAKDIKLKNILHTAPYCDAAFSISSPHKIDNVLGINVRLDSTTHNGTSGIGCLVAAFAGKLGETSNVRAYRCLSKFGTAVYYSNGARGIVDNVWAEECECGNGIFYKGGDGDVSWSNLVAVNNVHVDNIGDTSASLVFYGHNGGSVYTRNAVLGVRNLISVGNTIFPGSIPVSFAEIIGTYTLDVVARNLTVRETSSTGVSIRIGTVNVDLNIADSNLAGTISNAGLGSLTESGTTDADVVIIGGLSMDTELDDRWPVASRMAA